MMKGVEVYFSNIIIIAVFLLVIFNSSVCQSFLVMLLKTCYWQIAWSGRSAQLNNIVMFFSLNIYPRFWMSVKLLFLFVCCCYFN